MNSAFGSFKNTNTLPIMLLVMSRVAGSHQAAQSKFRVFTCFSRYLTPVRVSISLKLNNLKFWFMAITLDGIVDRLPCHVVKRCSNRDNTITQIGREC